jgi:hypothetical protein
MLPVPLEVRVQRIGDQRGEEGIAVRWQLIAGTDAVIEPLVSETDSAGFTSARLTLGLSIGAYRVRASVAGMESPPVEFSAEAILEPVLTGVPTELARAGETILLEGDNFSLIPQQNVVTFSGVRGEVISSTSTQLWVEVPFCLPNRSVDVRVQIGSLSSTSAPLRVGGTPESLELGLGEDLVLDPSDGFDCVHLPSSPGSSYLVVPHSTGTVGGAEYAFSLVGLTEDEDLPASPREHGAARGEGEIPEDRLATRGGFGGESQMRWGERVRRLEGRVLAAMTSEAGAEGAVRPIAGPARVPTVGDSREFSVLNSDGTFDRVTAQVKHVSSHAVVFLDDEAPEGGFTDFDLVELALEFDDPIHPTVTGAFGSESDIDGNGRVIILLTPAVNRLTEDGSDGYVGGFFFGVDLLPTREGSNGGEIFYAMVPDPNGEAGPSISRSTARRTIPGVLAHEFEHMVNFNLRILVGGATSQEALWLSEALAQMAEDLVGGAFEDRGQPVRAFEYRAGNWGRARRFLQDPASVSVLASLPPGTLAERGAGWLLLKQVSGQPGQNELLGDLAASTLTGVESLTQAVGRSWKLVLGDWVGSLYLDGLGLPVRTGLSVPGVDLRDAISQLGGSFPLNPPVVGRSSFQRSGTLRSSAPEYYIVTPPATGGVALAASGPDGRPPEPPMGLRVLLVRIQ